MYPVKETSISHFCFKTVSLELLLGVGEAHRTQFQEQERVEIFQLLGLSSKINQRWCIFGNLFQPMESTSSASATYTLLYINTMP